MEYHASYHIYFKFDVPYDLEDCTIVKEWNIEWDTLHVTLISGKELHLTGVMCKSDYPDRMYDQNENDIL
jgi:hypothetical protein